MAGLALALSLGLPALSQAPGTASPAPLTAVEMQQIIEDEKDLVDQRTRAEAMLKANANDYKGHMLLGFVLHHAEGDLARSRYHLKKSRDLCLAAAKSRGDAEALRFYSLATWELLTVLTEMDSYQEKIDVIDDYTKAAPNELLTSEKAWPLMKLDREDEARAIIQRTISSNSAAARINAWNTLGALEADRGNYQASYDAFDGLNKEMENLRLPPNLTFCRNMGEACLPLGRYEEAERYYRLAASLPFDETSFSNPYQDLAEMYLDQARFPEAIEAGKKMLSWSHALKPFLYQQSMAENTMLEGTIYLELGLPNRAVDTLQLLVSRPDRRGGTSIRLDQAEAGNLLGWHTALRAKLERNREMQAGTGFWQGLWDLIRYGWNKLLGRDEAGDLDAIYVSLVLNNWQLRREIDKATKRIAALAADNDRIRNSMLPYDTQSIDTVEWFRPNLVGIWGTGLSEAALRDIAANPPQRQAIVAPFISALQAEISFQDGNYKDCAEYASQALQSLPQQEALLRLRVQTRLGQALLKRGQTDKALQVLGDVITRDGTLLRAAQVRVPVKLTVNTGSPGLDSRLSRGLKRSPRFKVGSQGFQLQVSSAAKGGLKVSLADSGGNSLKAFTVPSSADTPVQTLLAGIHDGICAPNITINNLSDTLDGQNTSQTVQELIQYR